MWTVNLKTKHTDAANYTFPLPGYAWFLLSCNWWCPPKAPQICWGVQLLSQLWAITSLTLVSAWNMKRFHNQFKFSLNQNHPPPLSWLKCLFSAIKKSHKENLRFHFLDKFNNIWEETSNKMKILYFCGGMGKNRPPCRRIFPSLHLVFLWRAATHCS